MIKISHPSKILKASIDLPRSKSISNRLLLIQKLYFPNQEIVGLSEARDTKLMLQALEQDSLLDVHDAGTVMRFSLSYFASRRSDILIRGTKRMHERPVKQLVEALRILGAEIEYTQEEGFLPLKVKGKSLRSDALVDMRAVDSSQFISALIMIMPQIGGDCGIQINPEMPSYSYVQLTLDLMERCGFSFSLVDNVLKFKSRDHSIKPALFVELDMSSFFYWLSMAALSDDSQLQFPGLGQLGLQYEHIFLKELNIRGLELWYDNNALTIKKNGPVSLPRQFDFSNVPDLAPTFIVLALGLGKGEYELRGLQSLKFKESDRESVLRSYCDIFGAKLSSLGDVWILEVADFRLDDEYCFEVHEDHRMAMSLAPLAMLQELCLDQPEVVEKSYPNFWQDLKKANFVIEEA